MNQFSGVFHESQPAQVGRLSMAWDVEANAVPDDILGCTLYDVQITAHEQKDIA